jgi:hypothetical protein
MHILNKIEALEFLGQRQDILDLNEHFNPFAGSAWTIHFINQVAEDSWHFIIPEDKLYGQSFMLLYSDKNTSYRVTAVNNYYASLYTPLISNIDSFPHRRQIIEKLLQQLSDMQPQPSIINLSPLDDEWQDTIFLMEALKSLGWYTRKYDCFGNWYLPCKNLSFNDYMLNRESRLYNTWKRKRKKFVNGSLNDTQIEIVQDPSHVSKAMDAYERVYAKSWKKPEPYPSFVRNWAYVCARKGWLRLGLAWFDDIPIATQFWFTMHNRTYIFKLAYDEQYSKLSAGTILSAHMFKHALDEDRVLEIDYLSGDDEYKKSWMTHRRQRVGLIACNPRTLRGLVTGARKFAGELWRRWRSFR